MKLQVVVPIATALSVFACKNEASSGENGSNLKVVISAPQSALALVPANLLAEGSKVLVALSGKMKEKGVDRTNVSVKCTDGHAKNGTHCAMTYAGPEIDLTLKEFFFNLAKGSVVVGKKNNGFTLAMRAYDETVGTDNLKVMEVCKVSGIKAVAGVSFGLGTWKKGLGVNGLKMVLKQDGQEADGSPKYVATEGKVDAGWFGHYPTDDCEI